MSSDHELVISTHRAEGPRGIDKPVATCYNPSFAFLPCPTFDKQRPPPMPDLARPPQSQMRCDNCGKGFALAATAPTKRFCSATCRHQWHGKTRARAMAMLRGQEANNQEAKDND